MRLDNHSSRILLTRSKYDNEALKKELDGLGVDSICWSAIRVKKEPVLNLKTLVPPDIVIFTSKPAVEYGLDSIRDMLSTEIYAIGKSTAKALTNQNIKKVIVPEVETSEGLLKLESLSDVKNKKILLVAGKGGRNLIQKELTSRGANMNKIAVYRRENNTISTEILQQIKHFSPTILLATSVDILKSTIKNIPLNHTILLLTASERVTKYAIDQGFTQIKEINGASNKNIIKKLKSERLL